MKDEIRVTYPFSSRRSSISNPTHIIYNKLIKIIYVFILRIFTPVSKLFKPVVYTHIISIFFPVVNYSF